MFVRQARHTVDVGNGANLWGSMGHAPRRARSAEPDGQNDTTLNPPLQGLYHLLMGQIMVMAMGKVDCKSSVAQGTKSTAQMPRARKQLKKHLSPAFAGGSERLPKLLLQSLPLGARP